MLGEVSVSFLFSVSLFSLLFLFSLLLCLLCSPKMRSDLAYLGRRLRQGIIKTINFNGIIIGLCYKNRIDEAHALGNEKMEKLRCVPDLISYNILIDECCKKSLIGMAKKVIELINVKGLKASQYSYSPIIGALCSKRGNRESS